MPKKAKKSRTPRSTTSTRTSIPRKPRIILRVVRTLGKWEVHQDTPVDKPDIVHGQFTFQKSAWGAARFAGKVLNNNGQRAQAVLHSRSGRIITESTFGEDPAKSKG